MFFEIKDQNMGIMWGVGSLIYGYQMAKSGLFSTMVGQNLEKLEYQMAKIGLISILVGVNLETQVYQIPKIECRFHHFIKNNSFTGIWGSFQENFSSFKFRKSQNDLFQHHNQDNSFNWVWGSSQDIPRDTIT